MKSGTYVYFILLTSLLVMGCKQGVPELANLRTLPGFILDQKSFSVSNKTNPTFSLSGKCNSNFTDIQFSLDGGNQWTAISNVATSLSIDCGTTGTFTSNISFVSPSLDFSRWSAAGTYSDLLIRGTSPLGFSDAFLIELVNLKGSPGTITAGASDGPLIGAGYKVKGAVAAFATSTSPVMRGGSYKIHGDVQW